MNLINRQIALVACFLLGILQCASGHEVQQRPNILFILADDLGWGDVGCFNPGSKIPTPHLDHLASQGLRFTDAHSSSGVCVPSRFSIISGLHPFRMKGKAHPEPEFRHYGGNQSTLPLVPGNRVTLGGFLAGAGYSTAMVGKWHLGFDDLLRKPTQPLRGGPIDRGFGRYFGIPSSLDIGPYVLIEGDRIVAQATEKIPAHHSPGWPRDFMGEFWREDIAAPGFHHADILPAMTQRAERDLRELAAASKEHPFFLYYAMPAPHSPLVPSPTARGRTQMGAYSAYGDYVAQCDDDIGHILHALDETGVADNTLVIVSSDNGPLWYPQNVQATGHSASGPWRGMKGDAWEGGHRMPLIARWPGHVPAHAVSTAIVSQTDLIATIAGVLNLSPPATDGVDFSPALFGKSWERPLDHPLMIQSSLGMIAIRDANWKYINALGSGGFSTPAREKSAATGPSAQLYNLKDDPGELHNLATKNPSEASRYQRKIEQLLASNLPTNAHGKE